MKAIDQEIGDKALDLARTAVLYAQNEKQRELEEKETNMNELINELAKQLIEENSQYMPDDITMGALEHVDTVAKKRGRPKKKKEAN